MTRRAELLMWVGLFGAPVAWALEHVIGWGVSEANCEVAGRQWGISFTTWVAVLTAAGAALAITGLLSSLALYRGMKETDKDAPPPEGRLWLMSICGLVISPLMLALILLSGSGALLLAHCHQG